MPDPKRTEIERRTWSVDELRVDGETDSPRIIGHAAVFNMLSENLGGFREQIAPGAFAKTLGGDVRALFNHDPNYPLGRTKANTLRLTEDSKGLAVEIDPPDTAQARSVVEALRRGDVSQMSFGFRTIRDEWENRPNGDVIRTLLEVKLFDVSPVTFPAYTQTDAAVRSLEAWRHGKEEANEATEEEAAKEEARRAEMAQMRMKQRLAEIT
jgi:HK97 family phage prohead protease